MAQRNKPRKPSPEPDADEVLVNTVDEIDPYAILSLERSATQDQVRSAYRKAALRYHPDKAQPDQKDEANRKFQEIATAYAILSDEKRRHRYDTTGSTAESLDDDTFDWTEFFREQSAAMVSGELIDQIKKEYQASEEERQDVLRAYSEGEGDMDMIYETVMCSNVTDDDQRFRKYIDEAIRAGQVENHAKYTTESKNKKRKRIERAKREEREAMELAEELDVKEKLYGRSEKKTKESKRTDADDDTLKALIQQRQKSRSETFLDQLEAKYRGEKKGKRKKIDEPPEELFKKNTKKAKAKN